MKWNEFTYDSEIYDLSHLHPFTWEYTAKAAKKRPERIYKFHVIFSMHCFTRDPLKDEQVAEDLWYEGPEERRVFCFDRHGFSAKLPNIIQNLGDRICWHTHHGNFFTIELADKSGQKVEYEIYFDVTRASRRGWLNLVVQSAYARTEDYQTKQPKKRKIRLDVIAYNTQAKKKIGPA